MCNVPSYSGSKFFGYLRLLSFHTNCVFCTFFFSISVKKCHWNFDGDCIESIDGFGYIKLTWLCLRRMKRVRQLEEYGRDKDLFKNINRHSKPLSAWDCNIVVRSKQCDFLAMWEPQKSKVPYQLSLFLLHLWMTMNFDAFLSHIFYYYLVT